MGITPEERVVEQGQLELRGGDEEGIGVCGSDGNGVGATERR